VGASITIRNCATGIYPPNAVLVVEPSRIANARSIGVRRIETKSEPWAVIPATVITATAVITPAAVIRTAACTETTVESAGGG
jgi:hypothetical protein